MNDIVQIALKTEYLHHNNAGRRNYVTLLTKNKNEYALYRNKDSALCSPSYDIILVT